MYKIKTYKKMFDLCQRAKFGHFLVFIQNTDFLFTLKDDLEHTCTFLSSWIIKGVHTL